MKTLSLIVGAMLVGVVGSHLTQTEPPASVVNLAPVKEHVVAPPSAKAADTDTAVALPFGQSLGRPTTLVAPVVQGSAMGQVLLQAKDLRAFAVESLTKPEQGGAFYAALALRICADIDTAQAVVQRVVAAESTIDTERMRRIEASIDRCSQFSVGEIGAMQSQVLQLGLEGRDPLMALQLRLQKSKANERRAIYETMLRLNPALASVSDAPMRLMQESMIEGSEGKLIYQFNGQKYTSTQDQQALGVATMLSTCGTSDYCALDEQLALWCQGMSGQCFDSREQFVRQALLQGDDATFARAQAFAVEMRSALARGDTSIFH